MIKLKPHGKAWLAAPAVIVTAAIGLAVPAQVAGNSAAAATVPAAGPMPVTVTPCVGKKVTGPFFVKGAQVYAGNGGHRDKATPFLSYGPTVADSLDVRNWPRGPISKARLDSLVAMDENEIQWAADDWCANTVRIQVNQDLLFTDSLRNDFRINRSYLEAIEAEVQDAVNHDLVVVLNDSTESSADGTNELMPTLTTFRFWEVMTGIYGHGYGPGHLDGPAHVIFDLFNEPRDPDTMWTAWYRGAGAPLPPAGGVYYGMEDLALWVRDHFRARNLFWVEGPGYSDTFAGIYPSYMITVSNVVYAIHHPAPGVSPTTPDNPAAWSADFGFLSRQGIAPVVVGEWTNHELGSRYNSACWIDAKTQVHVFLAGYLATYHIGLSAYTLNSGYLLREQWSATTPPEELAPNPLEPTTINANWTCKPVTGTAGGQQGAGYEVYQFFRKQNMAPAA